MKHFSVILLLTLFLGSCQKETLEVLPEHIFDIESNFTSEAYTIKVLLPADYNESKTYNVAYLVDGYYHFDYMISEFASKDYLQDVILVGIFYRDYPLAITIDSESASVGELIETSSAIGRLRTIDLTFPENQQGAGGGGVKFYDFISNELLPTIEERYSVNDNRTIMGHSLGGYFAIFQIFEYASTSIFQNAISLDNQIWWADLYQLEEEARIHETNTELNCKVYMGAAKHANFDTNALINELVERLDKHQHKGLEYIFERYSEGHAFSVKPGLSSGLKYIYDE